MNTQNSGTMEVMFVRESLVKAETAALDKKGELVLGKRASRRQKRGMAQTYVVTWRDAETLEETTLPIAKYGLSRKVTPGCASNLALLMCAWPTATRSTCCREALVWPMSFSCSCRVHYRFDVPGVGWLGCSVGRSGNPALTVHGYL